MHTSHALGGLRAAVVAAASAAVVNVAPGQRDRAIAEAAKEVSIRIICSAALVSKGAA